MLWFKKKNAPPDVDKLLREMQDKHWQQQKEIKATIDGEIARFEKFHNRERNWFFAFVLVVGGCVTWYAGKSRRDVVDTIAKVQADTLSAITNANIKVSELQSNITILSSNSVVTMKQVLKDQVAKVEQETKDEIQRQFKTERINTMVTNEAMNRIDKIAKDLISASVSNSVSIAIDPLRQKLKVTELNLKSSIDEATATLNKVRDISDFGRQTVLAANDNRSAYDQLVNWANDPSYPYHDDAEAIYTFIRSSYYLDARPFMIFKKENVPDYANMEEIPLNFWRTLSSGLAKAFVRGIAFEASKIPEENRFAFLMNVCLKDSHNSLQAANTAAKILADHWNVTYNPAFDWDNLKTAWENYKQTNNILQMPEVLPSPIVTETHFSNEPNLIISTNGNVVQAIVRLQYAAKPKTLKARYLYYPEFKSGSYEPVQLKANACYERFNDYPEFEFKLQYQYEPDYDQPLVKTVSFANTNMIVIDGAELTIPKLP